MSDHQSTPSSEELLQQLREITLVATSVANGDLSRKMTVEATDRGEMLELKKTINMMVDQLNLFAVEATRIARELGSEGRFGGQMDIKGGTGAWRDIADNVNYMAKSLTVQVRSLSDVVQAVNAGDSSYRITVEAQGEMKELRDGINLLIERSAHTT